MRTIGDMIKKDAIPIKGTDEDRFSVELSAHWEDIIKGGSE